MALPAFAARRPGIPRGPHVENGCGSNTRPPANIPIPTKIGSKMGGEFTYQPKWDPKTFLTTTAIFVPSLRHIWCYVSWRGVPRGPDFEKRGDI